MLANNFFERSINQPEVLKLFYQALNASPEKQNEVRHKLYELLKDEYLYRFKHFNLKQLHFHTPDNKSFLRFHRPKIFGDDLSEIRKTISYVNQHKKPVISFEEGKIYNGYRFVYPLFYQNTHIGSVETSVSLNAITEVFDNQVKSPTAFIIKKSLVKQKVLANEQSNYRTTDISENYLIESSFNLENNSLSLKVNNHGNISPQQKETLFHKGAFFSDFALIDNSLFINYYFPIFNTLTKTHSGYFVITREHLHLYDFGKQLIWFAILINAIFIAGLFVFGFYRRTIKDLKFKTELLEDVQSIANVGTWEYQFKEDKLKWSDHTHKIMGMDKALTPSIDLFFELVHPEDLEQLKDKYKKALEMKQDYIIHHRIILPDGSIKHLTQNGHLELDNKSGEIIRIVGLTKDVTEDANTLARLTNFISSQNSMMILIGDNKIEFANNSFLSFFNQESLKSFIKEYQCVCKLFIKHDNFFSTTSETTEDWVHEIKELSQNKRIVLLKNPQNVKHAFSISISPFDSNKHIVTFNDITETISEVQRLTHKVTHDQLTGALNREFLEQFMQNISFKSGDSTYFLIMFDIDLFKKINDTDGHLEGDNLLKQLTQLVSQTIREEDNLIRWGGEEFIIIGKASNIKSAIHIAENMRTTVENNRFESTQAHLTCSFGVTLFTSNEKSEDIIQRADEAMYLAKQNNRNSVYSSLKNKPTVGD